MASFPRIQSPCPYKSDLAAVMDGDFCRMCKRTVHDLSGWTDGERVSFLKGCSEEVCVSYRLRPMLAAAAMAAAVAALPVAAQDAAPADATVAAATVDDPADLEEMYIVVGGITDPANAEFVEDAVDQSLPDLPVIEEKAPEPVSAKAS